MARARLKYVQEWVDRATGRARYRFRRNGFQGGELAGVPGSPGFMKAYEAALAGPACSDIRTARSPAGSVSSAIASYYGSAAWAALAKGTQVMRRAILEKLRDRCGELPLRGMTAAFV